MARQTVGVPVDADRDREARRREREARRSGGKRAASPPVSPRRRWPALAGLGALVAVVGAVVALIAHAVGPDHPAGDRRVSRPAHPVVARAARTPRLPAAEARRAAVPILMYHVVSAPPPGTPLPGLWVAPGRFAAEVRALGHAGFHAVTLREVFAAWHGRGSLPPKPLVLSFDDGYLSDATHAAPVLAARHWPGVLNLVLHNLGPRNLPVTLVTRLARRGWEIDSHTVDHLDLTTLAPGTLRHELVASRAFLRRTFGQGVNFFCYPSGRYDPAAERAVRTAGYAGATTEVSGWATPRSDPDALPRIRVNGSDGPGSLLARIRALRPHA